MAEAMSQFLAYDPEPFTQSRIDPTDRDAHNEPTGAPVTVRTGTGTFADVTATDITLGQSAGGEQVDAVLLTEPLDIRQGDLIAARGRTYEVVTIEPHRHLQRNLLRWSK